MYVKASFSHLLNCYVCCSMALPMGQLRGTDMNQHKRVLNYYLFQDATNLDNYQSVKWSSPTILNVVMTC